MDAVPSMLAKPADMLPLEFQRIKRRIPLSDNLVECCGTWHNVKWEILDACRGVEKLMTIEVIKKLKPQLNTRDEYGRRGLPLKY